ncbi:MAG: hypothetical protein ACI4RD_09900 [Kiritimatiellia bacterium]
MKYVLMPAVAGLCAAAVQAQAVYTNTWTAAYNSATPSQWGASDNWQVAYASETAEPESAVPTGESLVKIQRSANVVLAPTGEYAVGSTYFLGGSSYNTLNLEIPTGSRLMLAGSENKSYLGTSGGWQDVANNKVFIDIAGGEMAVEQALLCMRPSMTDGSDKGYAHIRVRDGGKLALSGNAVLKMFGGSAEDSQGRGRYTNILDIVAGGVLELDGNAVLNLGNDVRRDAPHAGHPYFGCGWVNVKGGEIRVTNPTFGAPIYIASHSRAGVGSYLTVSEGGRIDLGGKSLYLQVGNTNVVTVTSGGVLTNAVLSVQYGAKTEACYHNLVAIDEGMVWLDGCNMITAEPGRGPIAHVTFRIAGTNSVLSVLKWAWGANTYVENKTPPFFNDFRLKPHVARTADFGVTPIKTRQVVWQAGINKTVPGVWRISPEGGFQLAHRKSFELLCRSHDSQGNYAVDGTYGGILGEEMWVTNVCFKNEARWTRYVGYQYAYVFEAKLREEARLEDGVALATARPRGWLQLPKFTARQLDRERYERISVWLKLEAPEEGAFDLADVVRTIQQNGYENACVDESRAGYNVRIDLPMEELAAGVTDDVIIMDFVACDTYAQAVGAQPVATRALIRAASCEIKKYVRSCTVILR